MTLNAASLVSGFVTTVRCSSKKQSNNYLTSGLRLAEMLEWAKHHPDEIKQDELEFLERCQGKSTDEWIEQYRRLAVKA